MTRAWKDLPSEPAGLRPSTVWDYVTAAGLWLAFLALYHLNGDFLPGNDATANLYLPVSLLRDGRLSFTPDAMPQMFTWSLETDAGPRVVRVRSWDQQAGEDACEGVSSAAAPGGRCPTWGELRREGKLVLGTPDYYLVPSVDPQHRGYVNQYGPGAGLTALPFLAGMSLFVDDLAGHSGLLWYGGKFVAAFCVAASVAVVFLALLTLVGRGPALVIAAAYGAGTCVWSVSSQTLWQSGPNVLFLSLAAYCFLQSGRSPWWAAGCGAAIGWAVICRPTTALVALAIGAYFLADAVGRRRDASGPMPLRKAAADLLAYVLAGLPFAVALGFYNGYYLGSPWTFGQTEAGRRLAEAQLGSANAWAGSFMEGFYGLLISPSRGMLVYSPILLFAAWGMVRVWKEPKLRQLRPLSAGVVLLLLVQAKWFNWHGGWSFGYRLMVDAMPLLALCAAAVAATVWRHKALAGLFGLLLVWSVGVQVVGAYAYNVTGWNFRQAQLVETPGDGRLLLFDPHLAAQLATKQGAAVHTVFLDVDRRCYHGRLWSIQDNQLLYYVTHFSQSRSAKRHLIETVLNPP